MAEPINLLIGEQTLVGPRNHVLRAPPGKYNWTIPPQLGGNAACHHHCSGHL